MRNGIVINHGNTDPIKISPKVKEFYLINKHNAIKYCSDKMKNYDILQDFYPFSCRHEDEIESYPVIVKPLHGYHGYGIKVVNNGKELRQHMSEHKGPFIIQKYVPIKHEFRFNVFDRDIFQISHKQRLDELTDEGGFQFSYRSGMKVSDKFLKFVKDAIKTFHDTVGYDLGDYCVDVMKSKDKGYYLSEINSAYGIGGFTRDKLLNIVKQKYESGELEPYRVR